MLDFKIEEMHRHGDGFEVATVKSYRDQNEYTVHNRYGSWMVGSPNVKDQVHREPATISRDLPFALQAYRKKHGKFLSGNGQKPINPFILAAAKRNPLIAKLVEQGKVR